jgi:hypothetical protein
MSPLENAMGPVLDMVYHTGPEIPVDRKTLWIQLAKERLNIPTTKVKGRHKKVKHKKRR